jgi:hypothetical protein
MAKKKKVIKQKQKQKQKQSQYVKVNITNPVKKIYKKNSSSQMLKTFPIFQSSAPPIVNVSIPEFKNLEKKIEELKQSFQEPIMNNNVIQTQTENEPIQIAESMPIPKTKGRKTQTRKPLIIEEDEPEPIVKESKIPRLTKAVKEPTIAELKKRYFDLTGDKQGSNQINRSNKKQMIETINKMEKESF